VDGLRILVGFHGVSLAGEKVDYGPPVGADGRYEVKVVGGVYHPITASLDFNFNGKLYSTSLHPVQDQTSDWNSNDGRVQDFIWKLSGARPHHQPETQNHTAWYGTCFLLQFAGWREDVKKAVAKPPEGTKVTIVLTPKTPLADGRVGQTITFERVYDKLLGGLAQSLLNDIPLAVYTVTGYETWPDGSRHPLVFQQKWAVYGESVEGCAPPNDLGGFWPWNIGVTRNDQ
jgi:hypothetical protein